MRVFFDNCTSPVLASTLDGFLREASDRAFHIRDMECGRHAADVVWMQMLGNDGSDWIVITGDLRIQRNKAEREAFRRMGLRGFAFATGYQKMPMNQRASNLIWHWPEMEKLLSLVRGASLHEIPVKRTSGFRQLPL